ncbi:hypothetical protein CDEST_07893 [Colletotrichum destructivum]|uniref:Uncharacterized protein n=1 Tax=Colletotrichum destructivum TaxID=34406 RepID=A0AAX4IHQ3_9PEZI|nr:hypothetical protein CDEST_07893 [Colletotrichum destructivum]
MGVPPSTSPTTYAFSVYPHVKTPPRTLGSCGGHAIRKPLRCQASPPRNSNVTTMAASRLCNLQRPVCTLLGACMTDLKHERCHGRASRLMCAFGTGTGCASGHRPSMLDTFPSSGLSALSLPLSHLHISYISLSYTKIHTLLWYCCRSSTVIHRVTSVHDLC